MIVFMTSYNFIIVYARLGELCSIPTSYLKFWLLILVRNDIKQWWYKSE